MDVEECGARQQEGSREPACFILLRLVVGAEDQFTVAADEGLTRLVPEQEMRQLVHQVAVRSPPTV